jgi:hypothetical protein
MQEILQAEKEDNDGNLPHAQIAPRKPAGSQAKRNKGKQQASSTRDTNHEDEGDNTFMPTLEDCSDDDSNSDDDEPKIVTNAEVCIILQFALSPCC